MSYKLIPPSKFSAVTNLMRDFFLKKGFVEVHPQSALSILAACEDPETIATYNYDNQIWPLPQTGQMWLEHVLLQNKDIEGCFCVSTSYRNEPNPVPGRHEKIFPMFEFESKGDFNDLIKLETELLQHLGFPFLTKVDELPNNASKTDYSGRGQSCSSLISNDKNDDIVIDSNSSTRWRSSTWNNATYIPSEGFFNINYPGDDYLNIAKKYGVKELENRHEQNLCHEYGPVYFIKNFPLYTSPFWNMKYDKKTEISKKVDVILDGMETIGSAERSCSPDEMRELYHTISNGKYADLLHDKFSEKRVLDELEQFLEYDFFRRFGGGIGITRMISAMEKNNLLKDVSA